MTDEPNETPAPEQPDKYKRSQCRWGSWGNSVKSHNYDLIRADYLAGFTIPELIAKYDVRERSLLYFVRNRWKKLLIADGKVPPPEPKMRLVARPPGLWKDLELEYRHGAGIKELAAKYGLHPITIAKKMSKEGWVLGKKALPGWGARSIASPVEFGIRMENFTLTVRDHIERVLVVMEKFKRVSHAKLRIEEVERIGVALNIISKSFATIVETGLKLYKFTAVSHEAEESILEEAHRLSGHKAMEAGMKRGGPVQPNRKAIPIRVERANQPAIKLNHATNGTNKAVVELRSDVNPGPVDGPKD